MTCPKCGEKCHRDSVDVGVGVIHGPSELANVFAYWAVLVRAAGFDVRGVMKHAVTAAETRLAELEAKRR